MVNYLTARGVQQFSITIPNGSATGTAIINSVGSGAFILYGGTKIGTIIPINSLSYLTLTNSNTITATAGAATNNAAVSITGSIIDGDTSNLIKSVQFGTITIPAGTSSGTASISSVNNSNTAAHFLGSNSTNLGFATKSDYITVSLSGTTVTANANGTAGTRIAGYEIIEFQGSSLNQAVQNISASTTGSVSSFTSAINSVNTNNTIAIFGGMQGNGATNAQIYQYGSLTDSTTFTINVNTASTNIKTYNCSVVEFVAAAMAASVQASATSIISNALSATTTITSAPTSQSAVSFLGQITTDITLNANRDLCDCSLTDSTTLTFKRGIASGTPTISWQVVQFLPFVATSTNDSIWFGAIA